ncbi:hypothetical protein E2C01_039535 [Portunus trituberculatus]|uniref:Uncharacterized protein n=1 Tax=Portunus trituberculatus TaxID=210409 RepID=A0A5B7FL05_PORTR|nr:hypothetical protein [Portunus trituberculatus]
MPFLPLDCCQDSNLCT